MQNNVKYVFTHFVKYVTLDRSSAPTRFDVYLKRVIVGSVRIVLKPQLYYDMIIKT